MALNTNLAKAAAKAAVDAVVDSFDTGTGAAGAKVQIYDGSQPASPDVAVGTQTKLAEITLSGTAFGAATTGTGTETNYIIANCAGLAKSDTNADASGTAAWFRCVNKGGVAKIDGSVGASTASFDMSLDNLSINATQTVKLNTWKVRLQFK